MSNITEIESIFRRHLQIEDENDFSRHQTLVLRILAVSSSSTSIISSLVAIYFIVAIAPKRLVFRHQLIFFLLFFDLLKSCILLLYPSRVLTHSLAYYNKNFCEVVGFFTAVSIEGADFAILSFAIHTFLLIFKPNLSVKVSYNNVEGGLYKFRYFVYLFSFITPIILASLAFIKKSGYEPLYAWCYLPQSPVWYRLVLSWIPRYLMLISIMVIYVMIYFHVIKEFKLVGGVLSTLHKKNNNNRNYENFSYMKKFYYYIKSWLEYLIPKLFIPSPDEKVQNDETDDINDSFQDENLKNFKLRQQAINRQIKTIFIYPISYIFIWAFPFVLQITQYNSAEKPIYWLNCLGAFMQPFNGVVDTLVFLFRETPWEFTPMNIEKKAIETKIDKLSGSYASTALLDSFDSSMILSDQGFYYAKWRYYLDWLRIPFFELPTDEKMLQHANDYINNMCTMNMKESASLQAPDLNIEKASTLMENESLNPFKFEFSPKASKTQLRSFANTVDPKTCVSQDLPSINISIPPQINTPGDISNISSNQNSPVTLNYNFSSNQNLAVKSVFQMKNDSTHSLHHKGSFLSNADAISKHSMENNDSDNAGDSDNEDFLDFLRRGPPT